MRIAVITVQRVTNYGALLQAYASQILLSKYGKVEIIDYENRFLTSHMHLFRFKWSKRGLKMLAHDILNYRNRAVFIKKFKIFINEELNLTSKYTSDELENGAVAGFDYYVSGSDQIWNPKIINKQNEIDPIYFLSFVKDNGKKISLASSMGNYTFSTNQTSKVKSLLDDYKLISIREKEGVDFLRPLMPGKKIFKVLDPTLMLDRKEWVQTFQKNTMKIAENYILVYSVPRTQLLRKAISFFSIKFSLPVIAIDKMLKPMDNVTHSLRSAGPKEYISLFENASFVITDSFHGTCFSVNMEKPFICIPATKKANRQEGLLNSLGLIDRIVYDETGFDKISFDLDFTEPSKKLAELRQESINFLDQAFS